MANRALVLILALAPCAAWADLTASVQGTFSGIGFEIGCSEGGTGTTVAECALYGANATTEAFAVAEAGYGGVALNSGVSQSGLSFSGDSYAAFSDSITVTVPTSGGVLDLSWLYYSAAQPGIELGTCSPVLFNINGTTATSPPGGCAFGLVGQGVPFSSGVPVPIAASISGTVDLSSGMSQQSYIRLQYIEAVDFASASVQAASGTEYSLIVTSPEPSSLALFALASGLILARRRLFG